MKTTASALIFAGVAAATVPYSTTSQFAYTTIYPGYGKKPQTVTTQYQPIPTYVHYVSASSTTGSWSQYPYVNTTVNGQHVTTYNQYVTVYHASSTLTHYTTVTVHPGYPAPTGGYPAPTGGYFFGPKNATTTTKAYYELYEKILEVKYNEIGPKILPGYPGSGLNPPTQDKDHQPVHVKEYKDGKWTEYNYTITYAQPTPSATTFKNPGTYTLPAYDVTVVKPTVAPAEATTTCEANKPVTYGGITTSVSKPTTITAPYPAYQTQGTTTKTIIKYTTITCPSAGSYEVVKPSTTVYQHPTTIVYATTTVYAPGVYHHPRETVTVTKPNSPYTCTLSQTKTYPTPSSSPSPTKDGGEYPVETEEPEPTDQEPYPTADPSADLPEPTESYGTPYAGYIKRGGLLERRSEGAAPKKAAKGKRVILF